MASLKQKWKVDQKQFILIFLTFALGGSLCGYSGRKLLSFTALDKTLLYYVLYVILITFLWPICVLLISIPLGQFSFFKNYLIRMYNRLFRPALKSKQDKKVQHLAIFASGTGTNAEKIIDHFKDHPFIKISLVVCNKPDAGVLNIALQHSVPALLIEKEQFFRGNAYVDELKLRGIDFIVLAGFLWKLPQKLIQAYPQKIINIHPALLPKYGGKGMYGHFVHEAVIAHKEKESGITIHYVNEHFDEGAPIFQAKCNVDITDTPETLAQKIHVLEHAHFAPQIEALLSK